MYWGEGVTATAEFHCRNCVHYKMKIEGKNSEIKRIVFSTIFPYIFCYSLLSKNPYQLGKSTWAAAPMIYFWDIQMKLMVAQFSATLWLHLCNQKQSCTRCTAAAHFSHLFSTVLTKPTRKIHSEVNTMNVSYLALSKIHRTNNVCPQNFHSAWDTDLCMQHFERLLISLGTYPMAHWILFVSNWFVSNGSYYVSRQQMSWRLSFNELCFIDCAKIVETSFALKTFVVEN